MPFNIIFWTKKSLKASSRQGTCRLDRVKISDYPTLKNYYSKWQQVLMENCDISAIQIQSECFRNGKPKTLPKYRFPTYSIAAETQCLPLSYNLSKKPGKEPNPQVCCDLPTCNNCIQGGDLVQLGCFHTFHVSCLPSDHCCSICKEPLKKLIEDKTVQFNEGLL